MASKSLVLKASQGHFGFHIRETLDQQGVEARWNSSTQPGQVKGLHWEFMPSISFLGAEGVIVFREAYTVVDASTKKRDAKQIVAATIKMHLSDAINMDLSFQDENASVTFDLPTGVRAGSIVDASPNSTVKQYAAEICLLMSLRSPESMAKCKHVGIVFWNYKDQKFFKGDLLQSIIQGDMQLTPAEVGRNFVKDQKDAMHAEFEKQEEVRSELHRDACTLTCSWAEQPPNRPNAHPKLQVRINSPKSASESEPWLIQDGMKISFCDGSLFGIESSAPDSAHMMEWTARVKIASNYGFSGIILNRISHDEMKRYADQTISDVPVFVVDEDTVAARQLRGLTQMQKCLDTELSNTGHDYIQVPFSRLFVHHQEMKPTEWPCSSATLKGGKNAPDFRPEHRLETSHINYAQLRI